MSASSSPTRSPLAARAQARLTATVLLPTPPLPLLTAITCLTPGMGCWGCTWPWPAAPIGAPSPGCASSICTSSMPSSFSRAERASEAMRSRWLTANFGKVRRKTARFCSSRSCSIQPSSSNSRPLPESFNPFSTRRASSTVAMQHPVLAPDPSDSPLQPLVLAAVALKG